MNALWLAFGAVAAAVYWPVVAKLLYDWRTVPDYAHGLLIAPVALWMMWRRRAEVKATPPAPHPSGLPIVLVAAALLIVGTLGVELFLTRASLLLFAIGSVVFLEGWRRLRPLLFPFALLALTIPLPAIVVSRAALSMQLAASSIAAHVLDTCSVPLLRDGNVLVLPGATLQVAEACSGIRSLAALLTLGLVVARSATRAWPARVAIVAAAVPVTVIVNGVRVAATALVSWQFGAGAAQGAAHELFGIVMFALALACLMAAARAVVRLTAILQAASP